MWVAAFLLGFAGSLHCVGMCSPLAMLVGGRSSPALLKNRMLYHLGRALTYVTMGIAAGLLGRVIQIEGLQRYFSVAAGIAVLAILLFPEVQRYVSPAFSQLVFSLKNALKARLHASGVFSVLTFGALNGLLPCGLVYVALVMAAIQPDLFLSIVFMASFALGTVPALLGATYSAEFFKRLIPLSFNKWRAVLLAVTALIMIGRGLSQHWLPIHAGNGGITVCR